MNFQASFYMAILASILSSAGCEIATQLKPQQVSTQAISTTEGNLIFDIDCQELTDKDLDVLASLPEWEELGSSEPNAKVAYSLSTTPENLSGPTFQILEKIDPPVVGCFHATDQVLQAIARLRGLEYLTLAYSSCTPVGFQELSKLPNLKTLTLHDETFSEEYAKALAEFPNLQFVYVDSSTNISDGQKEAIRALLPNTRIFFHGDKPVAHIHNDLNRAYCAVE